MKPREKRTHCKRGHSYLEYRVFRKDGTSECRLCRNLIASLSRRDYLLKYNYGITHEDYNKLSQEQKDVCAICKKKSRFEFLDIDHCHKTGKIRGLLCQKCNKALGLFNDDQVLFESALIYLNNLRLEN